MSEKSFSDRQARAIIVAAEAAGFAREEELPAHLYDELLHDDARRAAAHLEACDPMALVVALDAPDPVPGWAAVERITYCFADSEGRRVLELAEQRGHELPEPEFLRGGSFEVYDRARAAIEFLWERDLGVVLEALGDKARLAPLPRTAIWRCPHCCDGWTGHPFAGPLPANREDHRPF